MVEENIQTTNNDSTEREIKKQPKKEGITGPSEEVAMLSTEEQESAESFSDPEIANLLERSFANVEEGHIVRGRIVQIHDSDALIDIGSTFNHRLG